jgi:hypothetical protein
MGVMSWKRERSTTYLPDRLSWLTTGTNRASHMISARTNE